ncbi:MAG: hypothetical protein ACXACF_10840 [Candidatus Hermodarchaeia archaeon]
MVKLSGRIGNSPQELVKHTRTALAPFRYEAGYTFSASDLGKLGVKIELNNDYDTGAAIILPPGKVGECGTWLLETIGQENHGLLKELRGILERLSKQSGLRPTLQRGDKKKIKDALKVLNSQSSRMRAKGPVLRSLSKKAI